MSRLALAVWVGALCAAAVPTWETWRSYFEESQLYFCGGFLPSYDSAWDWVFLPFLLPLRADLNMLHTYVVTWAIPVIVVLAGFGRWHSAVAGRRVAGVLTLLAVLGPFVFPYFDPEVCGAVPMFSAQWWSRMIEGWGAAESSLLIAAVLVLVATQVLGPAEESPTASGHPAPNHPVIRGAAAFLIDYWVVVVCVTLIARPFNDFLEYGLTEWLDLSEVLNEPLRLLVPAAWILCVLPRRTLGAWLMGLRRPGYFTAPRSTPEITQRWASR